MLSKKLKNGGKGAWPTSRDRLLNFVIHPVISGYDEGTNVKFCRRIEGNGY